jgi:hypothetical protein
MILPNHSKMDQVRNFYSSNQSSVINILYIVSFGILVYYLFMYYRKTTSKDIDLLKEKLTITGNQPSDATARKKYAILINDGKSDTDIRATETGAYTISYWMYITGYSGNPHYQSVLCIKDSEKKAGEDSLCLLMFALHPTQPKLFVNVGCLADDTNPSDMERISSAGEWKGRTTAIPATDVANSCNVMDVDLQRWIHVAVSVNKQIVDVYMDGKLARSCVLPKPQKPSISGQQELHILPAGDSFKGYISGIHFSAYADTPDQIYGRYQSGPYTTTSFWDYLSEKIGIRVQYTGTQGTTEYSEWNLKNTLMKYFPSE